MDDLNHKIISTDSSSESLKKSQPIRIDPMIVEIFLSSFHLFCLYDFSPFEMVSVLAHRPPYATAVLTLLKTKKLL